MDKIPISFQLHEFNKFYHDIIHNQAEKNNLNSTNLFIFHILSDNPDGLNQRSICNKIHLKAPTISITLQKMEDEGYLIRSKNANDSRNVIVKLTKKGYEQNEKIKNIFQSVEQSMLDSLTTEEYNTFLFLLNKMKERLVQIKEGNL